MGKEALRYKSPATFCRASGDRSLLQHVALGREQRGHACSLVGTCEVCISVQAQNSVQGGESQRSLP